MLNLDTKLYPIKKMIQIKKTMIDITHIWVENNKNITWVTFW